MKDFAHVIDRVLERFESNDINFDDYVALYVFANFRQLVEANDLKTSYPILYFYACWMLHPELNHNSVAQDMLEALGDNLPEDEKDSSFIDIVCENLHEEKLKNEISEISSTFDIRNILSETQAWKNVFGVLLNLVINKPLEPPAKIKKGKKLKITTEQYSFIDEDSTLRIWLEGERGEQVSWKIVIVPDSQMFDPSNHSHLVTFDGGLFFKK